MSDDTPRGPRRFADAEALARQLVQELTAARQSTRAIAALGYLNEVIASRDIPTRPES